MPSSKYPKPIRYYDLDGTLRTEYYPRVLPMWLSTIVGKWLSFKTRHNRDWYYYEVRLLNREPLARKFGDLWFLDHLERDHDDKRPVLWYERLLRRWIVMHYHHELRWFNNVNIDKINARARKRVDQYGWRYYPIGFNASMRLIYHGCSQQDYEDALDRTRVMLSEDEGL